MSDLMRSPENFNGEVVNLSERDLMFLPPFLLTWMQDPETLRPVPGIVLGILEEMAESLKGSKESRYLLAKTQEGEIVGIIGLKNLPADLLDYAETANPCEVIIPLATPEYPTVGTRLMMHVISLARELGYTEILLNMSTHYNSTAAGILNAESGIDEGYSKAKGDLLVWRWVL